MECLKPFLKSLWGLFLVFYFYQIQAVTDNRGNRDGVRELLRRIVQKKDWFSSFLIALRETQHGDLADDLSGNTGGNHLISAVLMCGFFLYRYFRSNAGFPLYCFIVTLGLMLLIVQEFQNQVK